ncbi:MAG: hypothetical protein KBT10_03400 [Bacteroidales bacterium]|nr:hypothetical protein [Candidatus Sodaliphilus aphodohippi]
MRYTSITATIIFAFAAIAVTCHARTVGATEYQGSLRPYEAPSCVAAYPDSLTPIMINHLGRHGSRYPAGSYSAVTMRKALHRADSLGTITPLGRRFARVIDEVIARSDGRWGALDSIGMAEHRGIARRLATRFPMLVKKGRATVRATYSPRAIMSMYSFTHELSQCNNTIEIETHSGHSNDAVLYPYTNNKAYDKFNKQRPWKATYDHYVDSVAPNTVTRLLGEGYKASESELKQLSIIEYYNFANMEAMGMPNDYEPYITLDEYRRLWSCFNLRECFIYTGTSFSTVPDDLARPLLRDFITTTDDVLAGRLNATLVLRFAHCETIMPLLGLMGLPGCRATGNDWGHLYDRWQNYYSIPMAANLQMILFKGPGGTVYVRFDLNEHPVNLIEGDARLYLPWNEARRHLQALLK